MRCAKPLSVTDEPRKDRLSKAGNTSSPKKPCASNKSTGNAEDAGRCNDVSDDPTNCARTPGSPHRDGGKVWDRTWAWSRGRNASDPGTRCGSYSGELKDRKHRLERSGTAETAGTTVAAILLVGGRGMMSRMRMSVRPDVPRLFGRYYPCIFGQIGQVPVFRPRVTSIFVHKNTFHYGDYGSTKVHECGGQKKLWLVCSVVSPTGCCWYAAA